MVCKSAYGTRASNVRKTRISSRPVIRYVISLTLPNIIRTIEKIEKKLYEIKKVCTYISGIKFTKRIFGIYILTNNCNLMDTISLA